MDEVKRLENELKLANQANERKNKQIEKLKNKKYNSIEFKIETVKQLAGELKSEFNLSNYEALHIASLNRQSKLFEIAFCVSPSELYEPALAKIANALEK